MVVIGVIGILRQASQDDHKIKFYSIISLMILVFPEIFLFFFLFWRCNDEKVMNEHNVTFIQYIDNIVLDGQYFFLL